MTIIVIKIPQNRVGALVGPDGKVKREIEDRSGCYLGVDSESGDITIDDEKAFEPVLSLKVRDVVKAIGRGFSPEHAFRLFQDDSYLEIIDITDHVGKARKDIERVRARIIGTGGKTRRSIEEATGVQVSIFGKTVGIVGDVAEVALAREAVEMLLAGASHATVYKFLERKRKELRLHDMGL
ncbi:MAG TPA: KH domain-containing protein [Candidatus Thermoplasmatota archaeon]|nr:KH domain-containing protein [Candidatus Thermoplasmatota archaeon]